MSHKFLIFFIIFWLDGVWPIPVIQSRSDLGSHIVILTPQAQVHLEPLSSNSYLQHLSSLGRYAVGPHDETVIYVPTTAGAGGALSGAGSNSAGAVFSPYFFPGATAKTSAVPAFYQARQFDPEQIAQAQATAQQVATAIQTGNFSEAAAIIGQATQTAAAQAATSAQEALASVGTLYPTGDPISQITSAINQISASSAGQSGATSNTAAVPPNPEMNKFERIEYEIPISSINPVTPVLTKEPRHHYFIAPGPIPQIYDIIHTPVLLSSGSGISTLRGRSLKVARADMATPIAALTSMQSQSENPKPEALPLQQPMQQKMPLEKLPEQSKLESQPQQHQQQQQQQIIMEKFDSKPNLEGSSLLKEDMKELKKEEIMDKERFQQKEVQKPMTDMKMKEKSPLQQEQEQQLQQQSQQPQQSEKLEELKQQKFKSGVVSGFGSGGVAAGAVGVSGVGGGAGVGGGGSVGFEGSSAYGSGSGANSVHNEVVSGVRGVSGVSVGGGSGAGAGVAGVGVGVGGGSGAGVSDTVAGSGAVGGGGGPSDVAAVGSVRSSVSGLGDSGVVGSSVGDGAFNDVVGSVPSGASGAVGDSVASGVVSGGVNALRSGIVGATGVPAGGVSGIVGSGPVVGGVVGAGEHSGSGAHLGASVVDAVHARMI